MDLELGGRVAVITGCSVGIGRGIAKVLAAEGAQTVVIARREPLLRTLQDEIEKSGGLKPLAIAVDLLEPSAADTIRDKVMAAFGRADIVVNNAGSSIPADTFAADEIWNNAMTLSFSAGRKITNAFLPGMCERKFGRVICITGSQEPGGVNAAGPAKAAIHVWAKGLSREVGKDGVTVNCIGPGRVHSEQIDNRLLPTPEIQAEFARTIPVGYIGEPEDIGYFTAFLCSPQARYITGQRMHVDGGLYKNV